MSDALVFRVARWQRQRRLIAGDPLALEPRIDPRAEALGFAHVYVPRSSGETARWLRGAAYAGEAAKRDPIDLCHLAIDQFHGFLETGDRALRDGFVASARDVLALGHTATLAGRACFVIPHFDQVEDYARHATPWLNAMVQGWAGAVLARAFQITGDAAFDRAARRAVGPCFVAIDDGGVCDVERNGRVFFEKYALPGQVRHVLNGFMAALLGLWDVARATGDRDAHAAFAEGVASLDDAVLATYDNGHTSLYDQRADRRATPSCVFYTWVHARQLAALSRITGEPRLRAWAARWRAYSHDPAHRARTAIDCLGFRARRLPAYLERALPAA
ncbi:MAG TPA: D-glucuronyl C5-epimerase family protein [Kofleriaceae bacterium]|nr:D-glucuronyl C5-epimerase family protein [Kofleriaceae bacterium]